MIQKALLSTIATLSFAATASAGADYKNYNSTGYYQPAPVQTTEPSAYGNGYRQPARPVQQPQYTQSAPRYVAPTQAFQGQSVYVPTQSPRYAAPAPVQPQYTQSAPRYAAPVQTQQQQYRAPQPAPRYVAPAPTQTYDYNKPYEGAIGTSNIQYDDEVFSPSRHAAQNKTRRPTRADASAQSPISLGAQIGTLGLGGEVAYKVNDSFTLRGNPSIGTFSYDGEESGIDYDADLDLINLGMLADWQPFKNGFRLTGGVFFSDDTIEMTGVNPGLISINDVNYDTTQVQSVQVDVERNIVHPYLGIGYTGALSRDSKWKLSVDLGAKYLGNADVSMEANIGTLGGPLAFFQNDLEEERSQLEDNLSDYNVYPVFMVGAKYNF